MNAALVHALDESGYGLVSSTRLRGRYAIRLCVLNHTSAPRDILDVLSWLESHDVAVPAADEIDSQVRELPVLDRTAPQAIAWGGQSQIDPAAVAALDIFAGVDDATMQLVAGSCHERRAEPGEQIVRRWDTNRDFYVILDGTVEVLVDTRVVRTLGPGDFFGELAAQRWGGGFGYTRLADVIATAPLRLLVVPHQVFPAVAALPGLRDRIPGAVRVRLPES
jgi:aromatic-L-amino-acid/L-tryptophan decarboxylase